MGPNRRFWCRQDDFKTCSRILECLALLVLDVEQLFAAMYDPRLMVRTDTVLLLVLFLEWSHLWCGPLGPLTFTGWPTAIRLLCFPFYGVLLLRRFVPAPTSLEYIQLGVQELWDQVAQVPRCLLLDRDY